MAHVSLNDAQVDSGFEKMGGIGVALMFEHNIRGIMLSTELCHVTYPKWLWIARESWGLFCQHST